MMNGVRPALGVEYDDKYINAKNKIFECKLAIDELTPAQRKQLVNEVVEFAGMGTLLEQFMQYMNSRGRF